MEKIVFFVSISLALLTCAVGCKELAITPGPEVMIEKGEATPSSLTFTVKTKNALECAYSVVKDGEVIPTSEEVLSDGKSVNVLEDVKATVENLIFETKYHIIAAVSGSDGQTASSSIEMATLAEPLPDPVVMERASGKIYGTSNNVGITLRGLVDGVDYEISLDIYDDSCKETHYLGAGTYTVSAATADGSLNSDYSYVQRDNDQFKFASGKLDVEIVGKQYKMTLDVMFSGADAQRFIATYEGAVDGIDVK